MTRDLISLPVEDLSTFVKALRRELGESPDLPGHLTMMNMTARAAGFRNLQHLRASHTAATRLALPPGPVADMARVEAALRHFDARGRLERWPAKTALQHLAVRALWARLPSRTHMTEREISARLKDWHGFNDAPILRRTMVELGLVTRSADCRDYCRVEAAPTPEARALIALLPD